MICTGSGLEKKNDLKHTQEHVVKIKGWLLFLGMYCLNTIGSTRIHTLSGHS
jgi:hypothetical protein